MTKATFALIIIILITVGCDHDADYAHGGQESASIKTDHIEKEASTLYSDKLELFVEFDPIVVGKTSTFLTHLTNLNDEYSPLTDAEVTLSLVVGELTQNFTSQPVRDGIYRFGIAPQFAGEGKLIFNITTPDFNDQFVIKQIHVYGKTDNIHAHGPDAVSGQVTYLKEQAWSTDFNVELLMAEEFSVVINASGEILAMPGEKQNLVAKNEGIVLFSTKNLVQGSSVKKGDLLFTISGKGFTDDNISVKFHEARLQFEKSKNQYRRHEKLVEENIVSRSRFAESRSQYLVDSVAYFNLKETVSDGGLKVFAPITGYIHDLNVSEGQFTSTGTLLATISNNKIMLLRADVPQQFFSLLGKISDATFRPAYSEKVYTIEELNGRLLAKASSVAENNHYMPVYFEVINDGTLLEGAFAEFHLKTNPQPGKLIIPVTAFIEEQNNFYVYVQLSGESFLKKQVLPGDSDGIYSEVVSGLMEGDRIVVKGPLLLKASSVSTAPIHSH